MKKKSVLIVSQHFYPENFRFNDFAETLVKKGVEVSVLTGIPNYPEGKFFNGYGLLGPYKEERNGVKIYRAPLWPRQNNKISLAINYITFPIFACLFGLFYFLGKKFDRIFVCQTSPIFMAIPAIFLGKLKRTPVYLWITDLWPESLHATGAINNKLILWMVNIVVKWIYKLVDKIYISSPGFKESIMEKHANVDIQQLYYWAEDLFVQMPRADALAQVKEKELFDDSFNIVFAGNIGFAQDFGNLVDAIEKIKHENFKVIVVGDGRYRPTLESLLEERGLQEKIILIGRKPLEEVPAYYNVADAVLLGLRKEYIFSLTIPGKLQGYMATGKPVLSYVDGEVYKIINDSDAGVAVDSGDPDKLAEAIKQLVHTNKDKLSQMGVKSREYYLKNFDKDSIFKSLLHDFGE